ncbi:MAG: tRNA pseudouridine(55) synthase TruB [Flavobacteriales bacterium]
MSIFLEGHTLLINKPLRWTSFDVVKKIRYAIKSELKIKKIKVGHAGTLDPLADGLLIICTGKNTKKIQDYQNLEKEYTAEITLGATTPSFDLETDINDVYPIEHITNELLFEVGQSFTGDLLQIPPIYSAIRQDGKRLYEHARKGHKVEVKARKVHVSEFKITNVELPKIKVLIKCSKGTYIRSLANDFGKALKSGGHLSQLTRTRIGNHELSQAIDVQDFIESLSCKEI